jgi:hypothetical protein
MISHKLSSIGECSSRNVNSKYIKDTFADYRHNLSLVSQSHKLQIFNFFYATYYLKQLNCHNITFTKDENYIRSLAMLNGRIILDGLSELLTFILTLSQKLRN